MFNKSCRWLDSNPGPLVSEATALPTMPQPLSKVKEKGENKRKKELPGKNVRYIARPNVVPKNCRTFLWEDGNSGIRPDRSATYEQNVEQIFPYIC